MRKGPMIFKAFTFALVAAVGTACASGPHVMVLPGEGRTLDQFHGDDAFCRSWAGQQSGSGGGWRYDIAYAQCMYIKGNKVPVTGGLQRAPMTPPAPSAIPKVPPPPEGSPPSPPPGQPR
jgi:hypothetical protein